MEDDRVLWIQNWTGIARDVSYNYFEAASDAGILWPTQQSGWRMSLGTDGKPLLCRYPPSICRPGESSVHPEHLRWGHKRQVKDALPFTFSKLHSFQYIKMWPSKMLVRCRWFGALWRQQSRLVSSTYQGDGGQAAPRLDESPLIRRDGCCMVLPLRYVLSFLLKLWGRYQLNQLCRDAQRGDEVPGVLLEWFGVAEGYEWSDFAQLCTKFKTNVFSPKKKQLHFGTLDQHIVPVICHSQQFSPGKLFAFLFNENGRCRSICWQRSFEDIRIAPMPSKMDCKEMRLTRSCRILATFCMFFDSLFVPCQRSGHLRPLPREPPIDRAWSWPQWCFGKGAEYPWGGALLSALNMSPWIHLTWMCLTGLQMFSSKRCFTSLCCAQLLLS